MEQLFLPLPTATVGDLLGAVFAAPRCSARENYDIKVYSAL